MKPEKKIEICELKISQAGKEITRLVREHVKAMKKQNDIIERNKEKIQNIKDWEKRNEPWDPGQIASGMW